MEKKHAIVHVLEMIKPLNRQGTECRDRGRSLRNVGATPNCSQADHAAS